MAEKEGRKYAIIEGNLLEYPVFSMERRKVNRTSEEFVWRKRDSRGMVLQERKFRVSSAFNIPNAFDMDVFNGIMRLYVKTSGAYKKNEVHFTVYELMKEVDLAADGRTIKRVRESLRRMVNTTLHFESAFYQEKEKVGKIVHLIVRVEYYEKQRGDRLINIIKLVLDDELVSSIERNYFKLIDFELYKSLPSGVPRRLYEYLEKKKYRKEQFEIGIRTLAQRIPLRTKKISQLKGYIEKANKELEKAKVVDSWKFKKNNVIYYFTKSERFKEVERDLFHLEGLTVAFYESLGQVKVAQELVQEGMAVLQSLIDQNYKKDEIEYALGWAVDNIKGLHSIKILPKVISQALGDRESRMALEQMERVEKQKRLEEEQRFIAERERDEQLEKVFQGLSKNEKEEIETVARRNLMAQGVKPEFILETTLKIERNKILEERK